MVKRSGWKTCWKRELGTEVGINTEAFPEPDDVKPSLLKCLTWSPDGEILPSLLKCLTWSPDGEILVAMMSDGKIHMMSAECGKIYYSFTAHGVYREINWLTFGEGPILEKFKAHDEMINFEFATPERFNFNEEATKQASIVIANVLQFLTETVPEKYYNTILIGIPEEGQKIDLYACGIVYFRTIDVLEDFSCIVTNDGSIFN
uniref:Anaphase-promoting complex subunit 4-like WD40 domain-containing protein n=1 Tax=Panagrolaimus sp. JU765 TaxID=591449 RepID=A0AC34QP82_9BILA